MGYYVDCPKNPPKSHIQKEWTSNCFSTQFLFNSGELNSIERIDVEKRVQKRGKKTSWFCIECNKYICKEDSC